MKKNRHPLFPMTFVVIAGIGIIIINQGVLFVLNSSWLVSIWGFFLTTSIIIGVCVSYRRLLAAVKVARAESYEVSDGIPADGGLGNDDSGKSPQGQLEHSEQLTMAGSLAAGIAHEIRNPLTSLRGFIQLNRQKQPAYTDIMLSEIDRINDIVNELLELAKPRKMNYKANRLQLLLQNVITLLNAHANLHNVQLIGVFPEHTAHITVECSENKLKQVFINIVKNAIEAMPDGGEIQITLSESDGCALVEVIDHGCGIPPEQLERMGEPFRSTKDKGTGLGLMICHRIIHDHQGSIRFQNRLDGGTVVAVRLPLIANRGDMKTR